MDWNFRFGRSKRPVVSPHRQHWFINLLIQISSFKLTRQRQLGLFSLALLLTVLGAAGRPAPVNGDGLSRLLTGQISPGVAQLSPASADFADPVGAIDVDATQISQVPPASSQGNRIVLNGQTLVGNWTQRDQQFGISDAALIQVMGVELLNSQRYDQQPLQ